MEAILIVKAIIDDVESLQLLGTQTFLETFAPYNTQENLASYLNKAFSKEEVTKELHDNNSEWYLALAENEKAGYLKLNFGNAQTEMLDEKAMEIERIYVLQQFQGKQIGKLLLQKAIDVALNHAIDYIWLGVWEKNTKVQTFYKKQGFETFSQHSFYLDDDKQTDWLMKLTVNDFNTQTSTIDERPEKYI